MDGVTAVQVLEQHRIAERVDLLVSLGGDGTMLEVDGELVRTLEPGQRVEVLAAVAAGSVVRLGGTTFYQRAQRKLRLSDAAELGEGWASPDGLSDRAGPPLPP